MNDYSNVKLLVLDFDAMIGSDVKVYSGDGMSHKLSSGRDGAGMWMVRKLGIPIYVVSNEDTPMTRAICAHKGATMIHCDRDTTKDVHVLNLSSELQVPLDWICYGGDDLSDMCVLNMVGVPVVPCDAHPMLLNVSSYRKLHCSGGAGAVREICDYIYWSQTTECPTVERCGSSNRCLGCALQRMRWLEPEARLQLVQTMYASQGRRGEIV